MRLCTLILGFALSFSAACTGTDSVGRDEQGSTLPGPTAPCYVGGCSGELCTDQEDAPSFCIWLPSFACYAEATCERQTDGQCGFTQTDALTECLANPPAN